MFLSSNKYVHIMVEGVRGLVQLASPVKVIIVLRLTGMHLLDKILLVVFWCHHKSHSRAVRRSSWHSSRLDKLTLGIGV